MLVITKLVFYLAGLSSLVYCLCVSSGAYPLSRTSERCFTGAGSSLTFKHYTRLERPAGTKN
jgi:hypothetical protein